jgi:hypothetical protein
MGTLMPKMGITDCLAATNRGRDRP